MTQGGFVLGRLSLFDHKNHCLLILGLVVLAFLFGLYVGYSGRKFFAFGSETLRTNGVHGRYGHVDVLL